MRNYKIIYIDRNTQHDKYERAPEHGDRFYTMGYGGTCSREFKKVFPDVQVECWKVDAKIQKFYTKEIQGVLYKVFPAIEIKQFGEYSSQFAKALKLELKFNPSVILNIESCNHLLFYQVARIAKNTPLVTQGHGETTAKWNLKNRNGILRKIKALINLLPEKIAFKNVDIYYALDDRFINNLPSSFKGKMKVQTIGNNPDMFPTINKTDAKKLLDLDIDKKYILFVGRLDDSKRVDILLDVWSELKDRYKDWRLLLAGNLPNMPFTDKALALGAITYGKILQTEMYKFTNAANIYVLANYKGVHTYGGVGMLPVQALFSETPVVGVTVRNIPEDIRNDVGIYTFSRDELKVALEQIMAGKNKFENLREKALRYYSWENISRNTEKVYVELIRKYNE